MIFIRVILLSFVLVASPEKQPTKYASILLTKTFGIVTNDDLAYDVKISGSEPYDPMKDSNHHYWQCVSLADVDVNYRNWHGEDGMDIAGNFKNLCDIEIEVRRDRDLQIFSDRRGHPNNFCLEFMRNWQKYTEGERTVCLNGEGSLIMENDKHEKYRSWAWNKFKTKKGCHSYFGDCFVKGCAKGKCPK